MESVIEMLLNLNILIENLNQCSCPMHFSVFLVFRKSKFAVNETSKRISI